MAVIKSTRSTKSSKSASSSKPAPKRNTATSTYKKNPKKTEPGLGKLGPNAKKIVDAAKARERELEQKKKKKKS